MPELRGGVQDGRALGDRDGFAVDGDFDCAAGTGGGACR